MSVNAIGPTGEPGGVSPVSFLRQVIKDAPPGDVEATTEALVRPVQDREQQRAQAETTAQGIRQAGVREQILASQDIHASLEVLVTQVVRSGLGPEVTRAVRRERKVQPVPPAAAEEATAEHGEQTVLREIATFGAAEVAIDRQDDGQVEAEEDAESTVDVLL